MLVLAPCIFVFLSCEQDAPVPEARSRLGNIYGIRVHYKEYGGRVGHFLMMQQPERFNELLMRFLGQLI
jgi:hypothetical protein